MDVTNKSKQPLKVPLPGGKRLFLGPGKTGQITPKAAEHPALQKLVEEGTLEIMDAGRGKGGGSNSGNTGVSSSQGGAGGGSVRHIGDR